MRTTITAGDVVRPLIGGPVMIVERVVWSGTDGTIWTTWLEGETVMSASYAIGDVMHVREPQSEIALDNELKRDQTKTGLEADATQKK